MVLQLAFHKRSAHTEGVERHPRSHCPVSLALEAIGDRWSLLVLRDLIARRKRRYQEFLSSEEGISTNILADRLARLERQGLVSKSPDPDDKRQFIYAPTKKGLDLLPVVMEMARWSVKYDPRVNRHHPFVRRMKADEKRFLRELVAPFEDAAR